MHTFTRLGPDTCRIAEALSAADDPFSHITSASRVLPLVDREDRNWNPIYKSFITFQLGLLAFAANFGSSIVSPAEDAIAAYVNVSREAAVLCVSLYIIGFAIGPLLWAPVSEIWGRRWGTLPQMFCLSLLSIGTARSENAATIFSLRLLGGIFASAPVSNVSASISDMWEPVARGVAQSLYSIAGVMAGPTLGPLVGAAVTSQPQLGWRWTFYIQGIWAFAVVVLATIAMPETSEPVLLQRKARLLRKLNRDSHYYHPHEHMKVDLSSVMTKHLARPLRMLLTEPMVTCITAYASFVYGLVYLTLEVFPIVFYYGRHWTLVVSTLPFLGLLTGAILSLGVILGEQPRYRRLSKANKNKPIPEARIRPMFIGGILLTAGLFWFGWSAAPSHHWIQPILATVLAGAAFNICFQQSINMLADIYGPFTASAVSANTFLRSIFAAGLPLIASPMFNGLGVGPAMSIIGAIAATLLPMPYVLLKYGPTLRKRSTYAPFEP
nr:putative mfs-type transporter [Quercus suber]